MLCQRRNSHGRQERHFARRWKLVFFSSRSEKNLLHRNRELNRFGRSRSFHTNPVPPNRTIFCTWGLHTLVPAALSNGLNPGNWCSIPGAWSGASTIKPGKTSFWHIRGMACTNLASNTPLKFWYYMHSNIPLILWYQLHFGTPLIFWVVR